MKKDNFNKMVDEIVKYIEFYDGKALVMGGIRIRQKGLKYNFTFEIDFTGKAPTKKPIKE